MSKGKRKTYGSHFSQYATPKPEPNIPDDFEAVQSYSGTSIDLIAFDEMDELLDRIGKAAKKASTAMKPFNPNPDYNSGYKAWAENKRDLFLDDQRKANEEIARQRRNQERQLTNPNWGEFA